MFNAGGTEREQLGEQYARNRQRRHSLSASNDAFCVQVFPSTLQYLAPLSSLLTFFETEAVCFCLTPNSQRPARPPPHTHTNNLSPLHFNHHHTISATMGAAYSTETADVQSTELGLKQVIANTEKYVRGELQNRDASHDFQHIQRVRKLAVQLGKAEGLSEDRLLVVELAALLHDIKDWKYAAGGCRCAGKYLASDGSSGISNGNSSPTPLTPNCRVAEGEAISSDAIKTFLASQKQPEQLIEQIVAIVDSVGFKDELDAPAGSPLSKEAAVVQDADRYTQANKGYLSCSVIMP